MNRIIWLTVLSLGFAGLGFTGCASSNQNVTEAPKQSPRERMKNNQREASDDLDAALGIEKPGQAGQGTPAAQPAQGQASPAPAASTSPGLTQPASPPAQAAPARQAHVSGGETGAVTAQGLVGHWKAGKLQIVFGADGSYTWIQAKPCRKKPCAANTTGGTYAVRRGKLYLSPGEGNDKALGARFSAGMLILSDKSKNKEWTLSRR